MELTPEQEADVRQIVAKMDCPSGFHCYESSFEDLAPVQVISGTAVECLRAKDSSCQMSLAFGFGSPFCKCPLRKYVARELGK